MIKKIIIFLNKDPSANILFRLILWLGAISVLKTFLKDMFDTYQYIVSLIMGCLIMFVRPKKY